MRIQNLIFKSTLSSVYQALHDANFFLINIRFDMEVYFTPEWCYKKAWCTKCSWLCSFLKRTKLNFSTSWKILFFRCWGKWWQNSDLDPWAGFGEFGEGSLGGRRIRPSPAHHGSPKDQEIPRGCAEAHGEFASTSLHSLFFIWNR